jgi:hypothetical protein
VSKRPVSASILDDGSILAVLSSNYTVTLYDLKGAKAAILRSFPLDNAPRTIALSPGAEVLGAAYEGGIEVYSLHAQATPTDRRAVNCDNVDSLAFSTDGTILLGTTLNSKSPTTVLISAQHFSTDMPVETLAQLWTTQVLFPRSSRDSSHASLLPGEEDEEGASWTFTYDRVYETFRAVRVEDLRNGHTYFTGPSHETTGVTPPATLPSSTRDGSLVAAGFGGGQVWVYGVPGKLDLPADLNGDSSGSIASTPERSSSNASRSGPKERSRLGSIVVPQWQVLSEKLRNVFICGREIGHVHGLSGVKFVKGGDGAERLVAVAGGGVDNIIGECGEEFVTMHGGRVTVFDFARGPQVGSRTVLTVEIGDGIQGPVEVLKEEHRDIEVEVALARRRTVAHRRYAAHKNVPFSIGATNLSCSATIVSRTHADSPESSRPSTSPLSEEYRDIEDPYVQGAPRSRNTLHRAATVARNTPQLADTNRYARVVGPDGRPLPTNHQNHTRARSRQDPDWVPPPPPYTPRSDKNPPLPPQLLWTLQGPPMHSELQHPSVEPPPSLQPQAAEAPSAMKRTRSTLNVMRGSIFNLSTNISASRSAPVSPARLAGPMLNSNYNPESRSASRLGAPSHLVPSHSLLRRGSEADALDPTPPRTVPRLPIPTQAMVSAAQQTPNYFLGTFPASPPPPVQRDGFLSAHSPHPRQRRPSPGRPPSRSPVRSGSIRRGPSVRSARSNVRRNDSRAGRSARANMSEARKKRENRKKKEGGGKSCVIM